MCDIDNLIFDHSVFIFENSQEIPIDALCNALTIRNTGAAATTVTIKGVLLAVGEAFTFGGNRREIMRGRYPLVLAGVGAQATVIQKFYTGEKECNL